MDQQQIIDKTREFIEQKFKSETTGHDYWHMYRVWRMARHIAAKETGCDMFIVELAALLHDVADWKFHNGDDEAGPREARKWLTSLDVKEQVISRIEDIIRKVSFKGADVSTIPATLEGQIVQDADRLDALGAIGIARTFTYGGANTRQMYDPTIKPEHYETAEAYKMSHGTTINHFYEKLLLLKDRVHTVTGKKIAGERHKYLEAFLKEFYDEWDGKL